MTYDYLQQHVIERPTVEQLRCATQIVKRDGDKYTLLFSPSVAHGVIKPEVPYTPVYIG